MTSITITHRILICRSKIDNLQLIIKVQSFLTLLTKIFVTPQLLLASNINWKMIFFFLCKSEQFFSKVLFITNERCNYRTAHASLLTINIFKIMQIYVKREPKSYKPAGFCFGFPADYRFVFSCLLYTFCWRNKLIWLG